MSNRADRVEIGLHAHPEAADRVEFEVAVSLPPIAAIADGLAVPIARAAGAEVEAERLDGRVEAARGQYKSITPVRLSCPHGRFETKIHVDPDKQESVDKVIEKAINNLYATEPEVQEIMDASFEERAAGRKEIITYVEVTSAGLCTIHAQMPGEADKRRITVRLSDEDGEKVRQMMTKYSGIKTFLVAKQGEMGAAEGVLGLEQMLPRAAKNLSIKTEKDLEKVVKGTGADSKEVKAKMNAFRTLHKQLYEKVVKKLHRKEQDQRDLRAGGAFDEEIDQKLSLEIQQLARMKQEFDYLTDRPEREVEGTEKKKIKKESAGNNDWVIGFAFAGKKERGHDIQVKEDLKNTIKHMTDAVHKEDPEWQIGEKLKSMMPWSDEKNVGWKGSKQVTTEEKALIAQVIPFFLGTEATPAKQDALFDLFNLYNGHTPRQNRVAIFLFEAALAIANEDDAKATELVEKMLPGSLKTHAGEAVFAAMDAADGEEIVSATKWWQPTVVKAEGWAHKFFRRTFGG